MADNSLLPMSADTDPAQSVKPAAKPTVPAPVLDLSSLYTGGVPQVRGSAAPGSTVTLYDGTTVLGTVTADPMTGDYNLTGTALATGISTLTATATLAGTASAPSTPLVVVVDTAAPIAAELDALNRMPDLAGILITGTPVLPFASEAAVDRAVAVDRRALAAITGPFFFEVTTPNGDGTSSTEVFTAAGVLSKFVDTAADGSRTIFSYTPDGQNFVDKRLYDASGKLVEYDVYNTDSTLNRSTTFNADGSTTTRVYTSNSDKAYTKFPGGAQTVDDYDLQNNQVVEDQRVYDASGALVSFTKFGTGGLALTASGPAQFSARVDEAAGMPAAGTVLGAAAQFSFTAADPAEMHVVSATYDGVASSTVLPFGTLTPVITKDSTGGATGTLSLTYAVPADQIDFLAAGQTVKEVYDIDLKDRLGEEVLQPYTITLVGSNDAPVAAHSSDDAATGHIGSGSTLTNGNYLTSGLLSFTDPDFADAHVVSVKFDAAATGRSTPYGGLRASVLLDSGYGATGRVEWDYGITQTTLGQFSTSQTVTDVFDVVIQDSHGGTLVEPVTVTATGTAAQPADRPPTLSVGQQSGPLVEAGVGTAGSPQASIAVMASDPDPGDSASFVPTGWTVVDAGHLAEAGQYGSAVLDTRTGLLTYTLDNTKANGLEAGQTATDTFQLEVKDTHGRTASGAATFTITGTDDAPVFISKDADDASFGPVIQVDAASDGTPGNAGEYAPPAFSPDSKEALFTSTASNLVPGDTNGAADVFVKDLMTGTVTRVSTAADGAQANGFDPVFSPDGTKVAFVTTAADLLPTGAAEGIVVKDLATGDVTTLATTTTAGGAQPYTFSPVFSANGAAGAFATTAASLLPAGATKGVLVKNLATGKLVTAATTTAADVSNTNILDDFALSPDGTKLAFDSEASDLVPGDTNGVSDVFVKDLITGAITRASTTSTGDQISESTYEDNFYYVAATAPVWSPDGTELVFSTPYEINAGDVSGPFLWLKDLATGTLKEVTAGFSEAFSPDGTKIAYDYIDTDIPADQGGQGVGVTDLKTGATKGFNLYDAGFTYGGATEDPVFLPDGTSIAFLSDASVDDPEGSARTNVFIGNLLTGAVTEVSTAAGDVQADGSSMYPVISPDGTKLAFVSTADNLVPGDTNGTSDSFVKDIDDTLTATPKLAVTDDGRRTVASVTGQLLFTDAEASDGHTVAVTPASGDLGTLTATELRDSSGQKTGVIGLSYQVAHATASAELGPGQTTTDAFTVTVDDGHGGTAAQTVSVALTEAAPAPIASAAVVATSGLSVPAQPPATTTKSSPGEVDGFDTSGHQLWAELYNKMSGALNETDNYTYNASLKLTEVDKHNGAGTLTESDLYSPTRNIEVGSYLYGTPGTVTEVVDLVGNHDWLRGSGGVYTDKTTGATSNTQPVLNNS